MRSKISSDKETYLSVTHEYLRYEYLSCPHLDLRVERMALESKLTTYMESALKTESTKMCSKMFCRIFCLQKIYSQSSQGSFKNQFYQNIVIIVSLYVLLYFTKISYAWNLFSVGPITCSGNGFF